MFPVKNPTRSQRPTRTVFKTHSFEKIGPKVEHNLFDSYECDDDDFV